MQLHHATRLAALVVTGMLAASCAAEGPDEIGSSRARLITSVDGTDASSVHVTVTADAGATVVLERTLDVGASGTTVLEVALAPASYTFAIELLGG
ncbi:MAG: hypothetical protein HUU41_21270, partial [Bryobacteraceae bacterium]|nr:hypothetical protein [Bryobacteraceae bacterium]